MSTAAHAITVTEDTHEIEVRLGLPVNSLEPLYTPALFSLNTADGQELGSLLETGRPGTLARKISRLAGQPDALRDLVAMRSTAYFEAGGESIKWEDPDSRYADIAHELGFSRLPTPELSGPGTATPAVAWVRYAEAWEHHEIPYYRQTTDFSCGPASLLMAEAHWLGAASMTRERERLIWRRATRFTGCGAWAMALQVDRKAFTLAAYDTEFLAPQVTPMEPREARAFANEEDVRQVSAEGIAMNERVFTMAETVDAIRRGAKVLILVNEHRFHGEDVPHWVVAHAHRKGVVLINDPWVEWAHGESWVDSVDIPVSIDELDQMAWWGNPVYRSVLVLSLESTQKTSLTNRGHGLEGGHHCANSGVADGAPSGNSNDTP